MTAQQARDMQLRSAGCDRTRSSVICLQILSNPGSIFAPFRLYFAVAITSSEVQPKFRNFRLPYRKRPWVASGTENARSSSVLYSSAAMCVR